MVDFEYEVIVVGGGSAGICAAIQAGRAGKKVMLVEKNGILGGTTTVAGVNFPGLFHAWGKQIVKGIGWEIVSRCVKEMGSELPDFTLKGVQHWKNQITINKPIYAAICDELMIDAGVTLLFHSMVAKIEEYEPNSKALHIATKTGLKKFHCKTIIDCTADANVAMIAGHEVFIHETFQPATLVCKTSGYDVKKVDLDNLKKCYEEAVNNGELIYTDISWNSEKFNSNLVMKYGGNSNHIKSVNAFDSFGKSILEVDGRKSIYRLYKFLRRIPGFENFTVDEISQECGVRETANIIGKRTVLNDEYTTGYCYEDGICFSFYPIDLHSATKSGLLCTQLNEGVFPQIPLSAMLPKNSSNFLVAGRCIASERLANSALRTQASCMAMGQAAGAAAAVAVELNLEVSNIPIEKIKKLLIDHGALVPPMMS